MRSAAFIVPAPLDAITGGSIYDRRIIEGLRARGWKIDVIDVDGTFPSPSAASLTAVEQAIARIAFDGTAVVDGLVFGAMPEIAERHRHRIHFIPLVHLPLALEVGIDEGEARRLALSERRALAAADGVIVTGASIVEAIEQYGVARGRIFLVEPGCDRAALVQATSTGRKSVALLCVANVTPGKGYEQLIHALAGLQDLDWTLTIVGDVARHPMTVERVKQLIADPGLQDRVWVAGALTGENLKAAYANAEVFVLATLRESYGMAVAEALGYGLPVVSTTTGEIPKLVGNDGGVLCAPGDVDGFRRALARVIGDAGLRSKLRAGAIAAQSRLRSWDEAVEDFQAYLLALSSPRPVGR